MQVGAPPGIRNSNQIPIDASQTQRKTNNASAVGGNSPFVESHRRQNIQGHGGGVGGSSSNQIALISPYNCHTSKLYGTLHKYTQLTNQLEKFAGVEGANGA
jgi:hypothetical protein